MHPLVFTTLAVAATAHLEPGSLSSPKAGETYAPGTKVTAEWVQSQAHAGTYRFEFSRDGGATWDSTGSMRAPAGDGATVRFAWTVPDRPTARGRFKVCQPGGPCDDADYVLVSGDFAVGTEASLIPGAAAGKDGIRPLGDTRTLDVTFSLEGPADVELDAFDAAGVRIASAPQGRWGRGSHALRIPRPGGGAARPLVLRLRAGGRVLAETVIAPE